MENWIECFSAVIFVFFFIFLPMIICCIYFKRKEKKEHKRMGFPLLRKVTMTIQEKDWESLKTILLKDFKLKRKVLGRRTICSRDQLIECLQTLPTTEDIFLVYNGYKIDEKNEQEIFTVWLKAKVYGVEGVAEIEMLVVDRGELVIGKAIVKENEGSRVFCV